MTGGGRTALEYSNAISRERLSRTATLPRPAPPTSNELGAWSSHRGDRRARYVPDGEVAWGASRVLTDKPTGPPTCDCAGEAHSCTHSQADSPMDRQISGVTGQSPVRFTQILAELTDHGSADIVRFRQPPVVAFECLSINSQHLFHCIGGHLSICDNTNPSRYFVSGRKRSPYCLPRYIALCRRRSPLRHTACDSFNPQCCFGAYLSLQRNEFRRLPRSRFSSCADFRPYTR